MFPLFPHLSAMKWWDHMPWSSFFEFFLSQLFHSSLSLSSRGSLFSSSLLSAIRVVSSAYLRLLIFSPVILIPACALSSLASRMMYSAYKLNKQSDNIQPWCTPFPILNQSVVPCLVLTVASWPAYRFLRRQVRWSAISFSLRIFHSLLWSTVKGFGIVNKAEVDVFLELSCFSDDPSDVGNLISGSSAFSKSRLNIWKFSVHVLLKPGLEDFEPYFASMWDEYNCAIEHSLALAFFGTGMKTDLFQSFGHCWVFQTCWYIECSTFTASSLRIWNSSTGILSPPLALFIVMLPKIHLISHSRMSGSRWVITLSWLSESWRSFLYSSSVYFCHLFLISSASVRSIPFLSFIVPIFAWKVPLIALIVLKRPLVFPTLLFSSISLHGWVLKRNCPNNSARSVTAEQLVGWWEVKHLGAPSSLD